MALVGLGIFWILTAYWLVYLTEAHNNLRITVEQPVCTQLLERLVFCVFTFRQALHIILDSNSFIPIVPEISNFWKPIWLLWFALLQSQKPDSVNNPVAHSEGEMYTSDSLFRYLHRFHIFLELNGLVKSISSKLCFKFYSLSSLEGKNPFSISSTNKEQFTFCKWQ